MFRMKVDPEELKLPEMTNGNLADSKVTFLDRVTKARERLNYSRSEELDSQSI